MKYKCLLLITIFSIICISCEKDQTYEAGKYMVEGQQLFNIIPNAVYDIDGNSYDAVKIGEQIWMKQNLRTTKYADGTYISQGCDTSSATAYWYYPDNNSSINPTYGLLYNWKAVMRNSSSSSANPSGLQGICPTGWHVPSDAEWTQLIDYVSSQSQYHCNSNSTSIAKALAATKGWSRCSNSCAVGNTSSNNNATGFSALPAGDYTGRCNFGDFATFWSATEQSSSYAFCRYLSYNYADVLSLFDNKDYGHSVRCLRNDVDTTSPLPVVTTTPVTSITSATASSGGNVLADGGTTVTARGVCWSTSHNPTIENNTHTIDGSGTGSFYSTIVGMSSGTTYFLRAYATNSMGTGYGNEISFTTQQLPCGTIITDMDGNTYNTIQIGNQCWMKENLKTTKYADGTPIPQGGDFSISNAYWYYPDSNAYNKPTYGLLYNWKALMRNSPSSSNNPSGVQGICPTGWHVPSDAEWTQLTNYVGSQSQYQCNSSSVFIAKALASTVGWENSTDECAVGNSPLENDATGFGARPADCSCLSASHINFGRYAYFWTSTERDNGKAYGRRLSWCSKGVSDTFKDKYFGFSVRCVRN